MPLFFPVYSVSEGKPASEANSLEKHHPHYHDGHGHNRKRFRLSKLAPEKLTEHPEGEGRCQKQIIQIWHGIIIAADRRGYYGQQNDKRQQSVPPEKRLFPKQMQQLIKIRYKNSMPHSYILR